MKLLLYRFETILIFIPEVLFPITLIMDTTYHHIVQQQGDKIVEQESFKCRSGEIQIGQQRLKLAISYQERDMTRGCLLNWEAT